MTAPYVPNLAELLSGHVSRSLAELHTAMPGRVERYDSTTQTADVKPLVKRKVADEAGTESLESLPVVPSVPVVFPGAGDYGITFPIARGDTVLLVVASASLDRWLARGGEVDPADERAHALSDAVAIPGLRARPDALGSVPNSALHVRGGKVYIGDGTFVETPGAASDAVVTGEQIDTFTGQPMSLLMSKSPKVFSK